MLLGCLVSGLLSNVYDMNRNTSSMYKATESSGIIKSEYQFNISNKGA
jgi:hypothetical protein